MITRASRFRGCLLGGAVGAALGAAVEFTSLSRIRAEHGPDGITAYSPAFGRIGAITDDTQMTLFTADGLLCARDRPDADPVVEINQAYLRWLATQGDSPADPGHKDDPATDGWLLDEEFLHSRRAPGNTCLSALHAGGMGTTGQPINDSTGSITGNILGALLGEESIPARWLDRPEGRDTIARMADLLAGEPDG